MELMSVAEVAKLFGKSRQAINCWLTNGVLPKDELSVKIGRNRFFIRSKIENWIMKKLEI